MVIRTLVLFLTLMMLGPFIDESWAHGKSRHRTKSRARAAFCNAKVNPPKTSSDKSEVAKQCSGAFNNKSVRTFTCIHWVSLQAEKAFEREPRCKGRVTAPLLMCIFKREVGRYSNNPCVRNGCGMSQFTGAGVSYVKQAFSRGLNDDYDFFWDLVGRPQQKTNKCVLNRRHALDRDHAVVMAATHLCNEAKNDGFRTAQSMAQRYNGHPRYKYAYGRFVASCVKSGVWKSNSPAQRSRVGVKSECRRYKTCGGRKVSSKKYRKARASTHHSRGKSAQR